MLWPLLFGLAVGAVYFLILGLFGLGVAIASLIAFVLFGVLVWTRAGEG